jgi:Fe-S cluster assembly protein SufD
MERSEASWVTKLADEHLGDGVLDSLQSQALQAFIARGFPAPNAEQWRYTDIRAIRTGSFVRATAGARPDSGVLTPFMIAGFEAHRFEIVDGFVTSDLKQTGHIPGLVARRFSDVVNSGMKDPDYQAVTEFLRGRADDAASQFSQLNVAIGGDGLLLRIGAGQTVTKPIEIVASVSVVERELAVAPRVLVLVEAGGACTLVERYLGVGQNQYFHAPVTEFVVAKDAKLNHVRLIEDGCKGYHIGEITAKVEARAVLSTATLTFGGAMVRSNVSVAITGERAHAELLGLSVLAGAQHVDNHTVIDHLVPNCESVELYKGIYAERSRGVFCGTIIVAKDAQKTNAFQANRSLLLSPDARIDAMPQLKIWADDVKCTHGATIGQLDENALFYLRSRGIGLQTARAILTHAFAREVTTRLDKLGLGIHFREYIENLVLRKLGAPDKIAKT